MKKRILLLVFIFVINVTCFNFNSYIYANPLVAGSVVSAVTAVVAGAVFSAAQESADELEDLIYYIADDFSDNYVNNHSSEALSLLEAYNRSTVILDNSFGYAGSVCVPLTKSSFNNLITSFSKYLLENGTYDDVTGTYQYVSVDENIYTPVTFSDDFLDYCNGLFGCTLDTYPIDFSTYLGYADSYISVQTIKCAYQGTDSTTDNEYALATVIMIDSSDFSDVTTGYTFLNGYESDNSNAYYGLWSTTAQKNKAFASIWGGESFTLFNRTITPVDMVYNCILSDSNTVTYGPVTGTGIGCNLFTDTNAFVNAIDSAYGTNSKENVTNADGTVTTVATPTITITLPVDEVIDEDGNITYVPAVDLSKAFSAGITIDDVFGNEATDTSTNTTAQTVTGAVTVANTSSIALAIANTYGADEDVNLDNFVIDKDLTTVFPFSLPWDIQRCVLFLYREDYEAPVVKFDFSHYYPFNQVPAEYSSNLIFTINFADYNDLIRVFQMFIGLSYTWFLILITRNIIRG